jgi:hypothetical protein
LRSTRDREAFKRSVSAPEADKKEWKVVGRKDCGLTNKQTNRRVALIYWEQEPDLRKGKKKRVDDEEE